MISQCPASGVYQEADQMSRRHNDSALIGGRDEDGVLARIIHKSGLTVVVFAAGGRQFAMRGIGTTMGRRCRATAKVYILAEVISPRFGVA